MFGRAILRRIVQSGAALGAVAAATIKVLRSFEDRSLDRSIHFSGSLGADTFVSGARFKAPAPDAPVVNTGQEGWAKALDFSQPPHLDASIPQQALPRFLEPRSTHPPLEISTPAAGPRPQWTPRVVGLTVAFCLVVAWIGTGRGNPLLPEPHHPHNPQADTVAEKFARSDRAAGSAAEDSDGGFYDFGSGSGITAARFEFAPRFADFYATGKVFVDDGEAGQQRDSHVVAQPLMTGSNPSPVVVQPVTNDAGVVLVRRLPAGSVLSSGTRVSPTDWALAPSELRSVIVMLPAGQHLPIKADIEVYGISGAPAGTLAVEIREQKVRAASGQRRVRADRTNRVRPAVRSAAIKMQKVPAPVQQQAQPNAAQKQMPPSTANANAAMALITKPSPQPQFPQLPFIPGAMSLTPPAAGDTTGQQILINLGVVPRDTPDVASDKQ